MRDLWTHFRPALTLTLVTVVIALYGIIHIPEGTLLPRHWGLNGEVDAVGKAGSVLAIGPITSLGLLLIIAFLLRFERNRKALETSRKALSWSVFAAVAFVLALTLFQTGLGLGWFSGSPLGLINGCVGLIFIVVGNYMPKTRPNGLIGYRVPWTLASETIWRQTHSFAAPCLIAGGAYLVATSLTLNLMDFLPHLLGVILFIGLVPLGYSLMLARTIDR